MFDRSLDSCLEFIWTTICRVVTRWFFDLFAEAFPPDRDYAGVYAAMSVATSCVARRCAGLISASRHAAGGIIAALPIGFEVHERRAGFALA